MMCYAALYRPLFALVSVMLLRSLAIPRHRRAASLQSDHINAIVNEHNRLRALQGAANMPLLKWNAYLEEMARDWSEQCLWKRGEPARDAAGRPYTEIGQNMHLNPSISEPNFTVSIHDWYKEVVNYTYENRHCKGPACSHYLQIVRSEVKEIGCSFKFCDALKQSPLPRGLLTVCYYGPAGNVMNKPFIKGKACSVCPVDGAWCHNGLCTDDCENKNCECKLECANCGKVNPNDCTCECRKGFKGPYCEDECKNLPICTQYNTGVCEADFFKTRCPVLCSQCEPPDPEPCKVSTTTESPTTTTTTTTPTTTTTTPTTVTPATTTRTTTTTTTAPTTTTTTTTSTTTTTTTLPPTTTTTTTTTPTPTTTTKTTTTTKRNRVRPPAPDLPSGPQRSSGSENYCEGVVCLHGGTPYETKYDCQCACAPLWMGYRCQHRGHSTVSISNRTIADNRHQARIGIIVTLFLPMEKWKFMWAKISPLIVHGVNSYCLAHIPVCCPGLPPSYKSEGNFITDDHLKVGDGYPIEKRVGGRTRTLALLYTAAAMNNALCSGSRRQRREVGKGLFLPQEALMSAVKRVEANISSTIADCCNATLDGVHAAVEDPPQVLPEHLDTLHDGTGFPYWAYGVMAACILVAFNAVLVLVCCVSRRSDRKSHRATKERRLHAHAQFDTSRHYRH